MAIYALGAARPLVHPEAWVHPSAEVIGNVWLGAGVTIWPGAVLRGDFGTIWVGHGTVIEDNCVIHAGETAPTAIGCETVMGHAVHVEGCEIGDAVLVGSGSVVLRKAIVETGAVVAAGALVPPGFRVSAGHRAQGVPARLVRIEDQRPEVRAGAALYRRNARRWQRELIQIED